MTPSTVEAVTTSLMAVPATTCSWAVPAMTRLNGQLRKATDRMEGGGGNG